MRLRQSIGLGLGLGLGTGGGSGPALLDTNARWAIGDNSYGAQIGNIDIWSDVWNRMGCVGMPCIGTRQARGGDRLTHLHDRIAPLVAVRAGLYYVMTPENDFTTITNDNSGGDTMLSRLSTVITDIRNGGGGKIVVPNSPNTSSYAGKSTAGARYNANIPISADIIPFDLAAVFNPQDGTQSTDLVHPNTVKARKAIATALAPVMRAQFSAAGRFDAGGDLPGNLVAWNPATAWTVTPNSSGLNVVQSQQGTRRRFVVTGTCASDETGAGTTADVRLRLSMPYKSARNTWAMGLCSIFYLNLTAAGGGPPVNLATFSAANGTGTTFNKQKTAAQGGTWDEAWDGPFGILPGQLQGTTNASSVTFDITFRGVNGQAVDAVIEIDNVNHLSTEDVAYGPATIASAAFTIGDGTNRPLLFALPTTSPTGSQPLGTAVNISGAGTIIGGGLANQIDAIRNGSQDIGDATPVTSASAAVPYTMASPLVTTDVLTLRRTASNSFGGGSSASVDTAGITVS